MLHLISSHELEIKYVSHKSQALYELMIKILNCFPFNNSNNCIKWRKEYEFWGIAWGTSQGFHIPSWVFYIGILFFWNTQGRNLYSTPADSGKEYFCHFCSLKIPQGTNEIVMRLCEYSHSVSKEWLFPSICVSAFHEILWRLQYQYYQYTFLNQNLQFFLVTYLP